MKKLMNVKNALAAVALVVAIVVLVMNVDFKTPAGKKEEAAEEKSNVVGTVTLTIRCDTIKDKSDDSNNIPKDGVVLKKTSFEIEEGDTVYDVLEEAAAINEIHMEKEGNGSAVYVTAINNIYSMEYGELSGWLYYVNKEEPTVGCGDYKLKAGDSIEYLYSCNMGEDLK